jgi:hypothetical protein
MIITILGAASGSLMTRPTAAQLEAARAGEPMTLSGAHTVGTADGGPGLPGIGWSREHGDLRIGHFVGLHAIQILPLLAVMISRRRSPIAAAALLRVAAASYAALVALLLFQALRGESIAAPGFVSGLLFTLWAASTAIGAWHAGRHQIASHQTVTAGA